MNNNAKSYVLAILSDKLDDLKEKQDNACHASTKELYYGQKITAVKDAIKLFQSMPTESEIEVAIEKLNNFDNEEINPIVNYLLLCL
jgi:hypothetical protein